MSELGQKGWVEKKNGLRRVLQSLVREHSCIDTDNLLDNPPPSNDAPYIPPTQPYELSELVSDLLLLSRYLLKPGGRLVFFLPTVTDEYADIDIESMLCDGMKVIANSLQDFGSWGRRVSFITANILSLLTVIIPVGDHSENNKCYLFSAKVQFWRSGRRFSHSRSQGFQREIFPRLQKGRQGRTGLMVVDHPTKRP